MSKEITRAALEKLDEIFESIEMVESLLTRGRIDLREAAERLDEASRMLKEWQDVSRTYLPGEHQLDVRIDGSTERREAA